MTAPDPRLDAPLAYRPENKEAATDDLIRMLTETRGIEEEFPPRTKFEVKLPREAANMLLDRMEAQAGQITKASDLIADLTDSGTCWFDHHGGCQEHGYLSLEPGQTCPQQDAKNWTAALAPEGPET